MRLLPDYDTRTLIARLWQDYVKYEKKTIIFILCAIIIVAATTSLYPLMINWAFDAFNTKDTQIIIIVPITALIVTLLKSLSLYWQATFSNGLITRIEKALRVNLYHHLIDSDLAQIRTKSAAFHTARFTTDITYILSAIERFIKSFLRDILTIIALIGAMFYLDWQLTLIALIFAPLAAVPIVSIGQYLRKIARATQAQIGDMTSIIHESISSLPMAKTYTLETQLKEKANARFETVRELRNQALDAKARIQPVLEALGGTAVALVIAFAGWRIIQGQNTIGEFTGFISALIFAAQPLNGIGNLNAIVQEGISAAKRIYDILDEKPTITHNANAPALNVKQGAITFQNVDLQYDINKKIFALKDFSLKIVPNTVTAFVGRSGAGKSSLLALLPRLYDPTSGAIFIDDQNIHDVNLNSLRQAISVVSQDVSLFDDTIAANIALGHPYLHQKKLEQSFIEEAAKKAAAHDFIMALPQGYQTRIGERGMSLSGGERQRLSIARAFLKQAPILLLDEATSALDTHSEHIIQNALNMLSQDKTTLIIAHRLSTIRHAHHIVVMEKGEIKEQGTHDELLKNEKAYKDFHEKQFSKNNPESI